MLKLEHYLIAKVSMKDEVTFAESKQAVIVNHNGGFVMEWDLLEVWICQVSESLRVQC